MYLSRPLYILARLTDDKLGGYIPYGLTGVKRYMHTGRFGQCAGLSAAVWPDPIDARAGLVGMHAEERRLSERADEIHKMPAFLVGELVLERGHSLPAPFGDPLVEESGGMCQNMG